MCENHQIIKKMTGMTTKEINKQSIAGFLASLNILPERKFNGYWMYKTPWKEQGTGSLKVDLNKELWIDFSTSEGGTLIDLILKLYPDLDVSGIVRRFNEGYFSFRQLPFSTKKEKSGQALHILKKEGLLEHIDFCNYLLERAIDPHLAKKYLKAYQYRHGDRAFWNLGMLNYAGGLNLFNRGFKRATKQSFSLIQNKESNTRIYFEGVLDFLSFLQLKPKQEYLHEFCILNSVNNLKKCLEQLSVKPKIVGFLDNDVAGEKATLELKKYAEKNQIKFIDCRNYYEGHKDLNDYIVAGR